MHFPAKSREIIGFETIRCKNYGVSFSGSPYIVPTLQVTTQSSSCGKNGSLINSNNVMHSRLLCSLRHRSSFHVVEKEELSPDDSVGANIASRLCLNLKHILETKPSLACVSLELRQT